MAIKAFFDGIGKTHVHLVAAIAMNAINVFLCWALIFGHFGAPRMGAPGAGLAAFVATWIGLFIMVVYAALVRAEFRPMQWSKISRKLTWSILKLSVPAGLATLVMMLGFGLFTSVVGRLDAACIAFGTATATLVAQSIGAKRPEDAEKFGWASVRLGVVIFGVLGLCEGVFFTRQIVAFISRSEAVRAAAFVPMQIMGVVTPIIAVAMILSEALFGAGNPRFVAIVQLVLVFGCLVPLAYVLGVVAHMGLVGIWAAACVYSILAAVAMSFKFRQGKWKAIRL
jgi:MATE family multidrug resistance protein